MIDKNFAKYLQSGSYAVYKDVGLFKDWEEGRISDKACIDQWRRNNEVREEVGSVYNFTKWLNSLGYHRARNK